MRHTSTHTLIAPRAHSKPVSFAGVVELSCVRFFPSSLAPSPSHASAAAAQGVLSASGRAVQRAAVGTGRARGRACLRRQVRSMQGARLRGSAAAMSGRRQTPEDRVRAQGSETRSRSLQSRPNQEAGRHLAGESVEPEAQRLSLCVEGRSTSGVGVRDARRTAREHERPVRWRERVERHPGVAALHKPPRALPRVRQQPPRACDCLAPLVRTALGAPPCAHARGVRQGARGRRERFGFGGPGARGGRGGGGRPAFAGAGPRARGEKHTARTALSARVSPRAPPEPCRAKGARVVSARRRCCGAGGALGQGARTRGCGARAPARSSSDMWASSQCAR